MEENPTVTGEFTARYTIERELGRGGAAVVYLARDNRQERHVALKVLHKELAQAIGAQRFLREIKHSSALQHPHLLTILDSGESRGTLYFVMPYMPDGSLRTRIAREKQLPIDDALRITKDVGEALAYAHSKGIVHRDIKPDNVLFSADHACLADFGIARAVDSVAADTLTSTGLVVGTPAYMSPEQASGEKTVDARSDQYSLACLLYEMVTGLPPFIGATQQSVISQRFTQPPPSMRAHRPNVPDHVERAVKRALAVVPADRFPSVTEFVEALHDPSAAPDPVSVHRIRRRWFAVGAAAAVVTLAVVAAKPGAEWVRGAWGTPVDTTKFVVLPFASSGPQGTIGALDVASSVHAGLDHWDGVTVVDQATIRSALSRRRDGAASLESALDIARGLGAGRLVWGTVARDARETRINAALYDVASGSSLRDTLFVSGSPTVADSSLRKMVNGLLVVPAFPAGFDDGQSGTASFDAWQAYGRGVIALDTGNYSAAYRELSAAVRSDPRFAVANVWLAHVAAIVAPKAQHEWTSFAARASSFGTQLRPRDATRAEALLAFGRGAYGTACPLFRRLVKTDSLDAHAWYSLGECLLVDGQVLRDARSPTGWRFRSSWHSAGAAFLRALELEPRLHSELMFTRLRRVFPTSFNQLRVGAYVDSDSVFMYAYPDIAGDTVIHVPHTPEATARGRARSNPATHARILDGNKDVQLRAARSWIAVSPRSGDAFEALAGVLEARGELVGEDPESSALASVRRARMLSSDTKTVSLIETEVRVLVKSERFSEAKLLADSLLRSPRSGVSPEARGLMSALTGRPMGMVDGMKAQHFDDMESLEAPVLLAAAEFLSVAAVGACSERFDRLERKLEGLILSYVQPARMAVARSRLRDDALSLAAPCTGGVSARRLGNASTPLLEMQQAYALGNTAAVRSGFDALARIRRGTRASNVSPSYLVREAWLRAAIGDSAEAVRQLDFVLDALPSLPANMLENAIQAASLVRAMALRAELGAALGEREAAGRWARAVATLWADADPLLQPTVQRMKKLAN